MPRTILPPRYETLIRYCRDQHVSRLVAGRSQWVAPQNTPWLSLRRWLADLVLPTAPRSIRLYAERHDKEVLLTDFPLEMGGSAAPPPGHRDDSRLATLEARVADLERQIFELLDQLAEEDEQPSDEPPSWVSTLAKTWLGVSLSPQSEVGED